MRYDPRAEPVVGKIVSGRPCYVPSCTLQALAAEPGRCLSIWRLGSQITTIETDDHAMVRATEPWGRDLETGIAWWTARRLRAPASPAGLIREAAPQWYRPASWTYHGWALGHLAGGWEETQVRGVITGPHTLYDLRRAYRWSLAADDLPDRRRATVARLFVPHWPGLHLVDVEPWPAAPWPLRDGGRVLVESPLDFERWGRPRIRQWLGGTYWHGLVSTGELGDVIDATGVAACARTFWGPWIARTPVTRTYRTGTVTTLKPNTTDGIRAHLILQRVRRRLAEVQAPYRYVDAVITDQPLAVGEQPGEWRAVKHYPDGLWIGWPGAYGPAATAPDKLSGRTRAV